MYEVKYKQKLFQTQLLVNLPWISPFSWDQKKYVRHKNNLTEFIEGFFTLSNSQVYDLLFKNLLWFITPYIIKIFTKITLFLILFLMLLIITMVYSFMIYKPLLFIYHFFNLIKRFQFASLYWLCVIIYCC